MLCAWDILGQEQAKSRPAFLPEFAVNLDILFKTIFPFSDTLQCSCSVAVVTNTKSVNWVPRAQLYSQVHVNIPARAHILRSNRGSMQHAANIALPTSLGSGIAPDHRRAALVVILFT